MSKNLLLNKLLKNGPLRIGVTLIPLKEDKWRTVKTKKYTRIIKEKTLTYRNLDDIVEPDLHGFYDPMEIVPLEYDLVTLKTPTSYLTGWWNGAGWTCRHLSKGTPILAWRRKATTEE